MAQVFGGTDQGCEEKPAAQEDVGCSEDAACPQLGCFLTLLHPSSVMPWLSACPAPGWEERNVASVLGCLQGTGKAEKADGTKWVEMARV